jgi:beta-glucosidase
MNQNCLIEALVQVNPNVVVILQGGAPMELPWADKVKGILLCYLGGEGGGAAAVNLLLGKAVPSGKLAETWPLKLSDNPSYLYFPGEKNTVEYRESIYVGYRYYEAAKKTVRYPFGYGLSYISFSYKNLMINHSEYDYGDEIVISFELTNHGTVKGKETVMVFVGHQSDQVFLPIKELREFQKINLEPGETKKVTVILDTKTFGYYNTILKDWYAQPGEYRIMVCSSVDVCHLSDTITIHNKVQPQPNYAQKCPSYFHFCEGTLRIPDQEFQSLYGRDLPESNRVSKRPYHRNHTLEDVRHTMIGRTILLISKIIAKKYSHGSMEEEKMILSSVMEIPFRSLPSMSGGMVSEKLLEGVLTIMNGHFLKGIGIMVKKEKEK